jgi:hypothetical protein
MLYNFFVNRDINDFNARRIPITDFKNNMIESCKEFCYYYLKIIYQNSINNLIEEIIKIKK